MRQAIKGILIAGVVVLIGYIFAISMVHGMVAEDQARDAQRKARCDSYGNNIKPAECALVGGQNVGHK